MLNAKILLLSLCTVVILSALLGLAEMWFFFIPWPIFLKIMGSLLIFGMLCSFLAAINYDFPASHRKFFLLGAAGLSALCSLILSLQIWFQPFEWSFFLKLLASNLIAIALLSLLCVITEDFGTNKHLKENDFID